MQNAFDAAALARPSLLTVSEPKTIVDNSLSAVDTTFVLFFLALEIGRSGVGISIESGLSVLTLLAFAFIPYFLSNVGETRGLARWAAGRGILAAVGILLGAMLSQAIGPVFPEMTRFLPMTLLIVAAIISSTVQLYAILKHRLAR